MESAGRFSVLAVFAIVSLLFSVLAAQGQFTILPYTDPLPPCYNGIKDDNETGVDCGPVCTLQDVKETCDTIDNDRDCLIDENCTGNRGVGAPGGGGGAATSPITQPKRTEAMPNCSDGYKNQDEVGVDCGGACFKDWIIESCDGLDNNMDCHVDEGGVCDAKANGEAVSTRASDGNSQQALTPTAAPAVVPQPTSAPETGSVPVGEGEAEPAPSIPAEKAPSSQPALVDGSSGLSQEEATLQASQIRQFAKKNSIYIPENEQDSELLKKYLEFGKKHEAEFEAKFQGKELTEKDIAEVLRQFSDETYPKPEAKPQSQSFFSKVRGFFKRLFG